MTSLTRLFFYTKQTAQATEEKEKQILSASEIRQKFYCSKAKAELTVSAKRFEAKVTCSQGKKEMGENLESRICTNIKQISENAGRAGKLYFS